MNRALKFRRRLAWTWAAVALVLVVAFYLAVRGAGEAVEQERWVAHTNEVLGGIGEARLELARLANGRPANQLTGEAFRRISAAAPPG